MASSTDKKQEIHSQDKSFIQKQDTMYFYFSEL